MSISQRGPVDAVFALALIHHICISGNVPIDNFLDCLKGIASTGVIEWVDKKDPMVQFLLKNRKDVFIDYEWNYFYKTLEDKFRVIEVVEINNGLRKLCFVGSK